MIVKTIVSDGSLEHGNSYFFSHLCQSKIHHPGVRAAASRASAELLQERAHHLFFRHDISQ